MPKDFVAMGRRMALHIFQQRSGVPVDAGTEGFEVKGLGRKEVTVPAGTYEATLRQIVDADGNVLATSNFNSDIPPFGVVKSETDSSRMELLGHGDDATSAITKQPGLMTTPPGMPPGRRRLRPIPGTDGASIHPFCIAKAPKP